MLTSGPERSAQQKQCYEICNKIRKILFLFLVLDYSDRPRARWKIAIFFALVAAVYPKVQFISRRMYVNGEMKDHSQAIASYMMDQRYELESETADTMTFRVKGLGGKILKMCEDRIVITKTEEGFFMEGLRKDVLKLASGLEYRLNPQE